MPLDWEADVLTVPEYTNLSKARWSPTTKDTSIWNNTALSRHDGRLPCKDTFIWNNTTLNKHDGRLPRKDTPTWRTRPSTDLNHPSYACAFLWTTRPPAKPHGRLPYDRHPSESRPPSTHLMAEYRTPPTLRRPLGNFSP